MEIIKKIIFLVIVLVLSLLLATQFGIVYIYLFPQKTGGGFFTIPDNAGDYLIGVPLSYIFFLTLLFTAFGGAKRYWWIGILLIPAAAFEVYFDLPHIYFPATLGIIGWSLGFLLSKAANRTKIG